MDKSRILPGGSEYVAYLLMYSSGPEFQRSHLYPVGNILPVVVVTYGEAENRTKITRGSCPL